MSTILQALQKSKLEQTDTYQPSHDENSNLFKWKVAISASLFIIIMLLCSLIYLLLNPRQTTTIQPDIAIVAEAVQPSDNISKITFETKPLPTSIPINKKTMPAVKVVAITPKPTLPPKPTPVVYEYKQSDHTETAQEQITNDNKNENTEVPLNYENTSDELKKRFELAVLLSDIENDDQNQEQIDLEEAMSDGSDINEMSNDFQRKVPTIRYDSHMYSSIAKDRWIRINGERLTEGEVDSTGKLELIEIQAQRSIFRLERQSFSVESLVDWESY